MTESIMLTENEKKVLKTLVALQEPVWVSELSKRTGLPESTLYSTIELLKSKGLVKEEVIHEISYLLTKEGEKTLSQGFPEEILLRTIKKHNTHDISELRKLIDPKTLQIALGAAKRKGLITIEKGEIRILKEDTELLEREKKILDKIKNNVSLTEIDQDVLESLEKRGLIEKKLIRKKRITPVLPLARMVLQKQEKTISRLSSKHIVSGEWRNVLLKEYNVEAEPPQYNPGIYHFYKLFIDWIKQVLYEMGFTETRGPIIETEFWNFDVLFQAQDHPAREIHDTFWLDMENNNIDASEELIKKTKIVHETGGTTGSKGWRTIWDSRISARLILRTQTTSVSARTLSKKPKPPYRFFTIGKVFRPDVVDARHLPEFTQLDGIISEENMNFSKLLGTIKEIFERMGFKELKFKPAYFPFTEPSVEGYIKIPGQGWVEVFGAGMFRPEMLEILGIDHQVGAWGIGLDRLAMSLLEIQDIRILYHKNVGLLRKLYPSIIRKILL